MSKAIEAYERVEEVTKESNFKFGVSSETYDFEFIEKPKLSEDEYISTVEKISKDWSYKNNMGNVPTIFMSEGKNVLFFKLEVPKLLDFLRRKPESVTALGFSISRDYEKAKELADYMLETLKSQHGYVNEKHVKEFDEITEGIRPP